MAKVHGHLIIIHLSMSASCAIQKRLLSLATAITAVLVTCLRAKRYNSAIYCDTIALHGFKESATINLNCVHVLR